MLSVVIPSYKEEDMIEKTAKTITSILRDRDIDYELIFVDDGSTDSTWDKILGQSAKNPKVRGLRFSRNFGKEAAIVAGLEHIKGDCCVLIDCDLQHPPEIIPQMYDKWLQGIQIVEAEKADRGKESWFRKTATSVFYKMISKAVGIDMERSSDFKLMDKKVVEAVLRLPERRAFFRAVSAWVGFKKDVVEFEVQEREAGASKWSTKDLIRYAIRNIAAFSTSAMQFASVIGSLSIITALILAIIRAIEIIFTDKVFTLNYIILISIFLMSGIILVFQGVTAYYIDYILEETKARPRYIVADEV